MKTILSIIILSIFTMKGLSQSEYKDITFSFKEFVQPKNATEWKARTQEIRKTIWKCFGDMPAISKKVATKITNKEDKGDYIIESFEFFNGVDATIPGLVLIPKNATGKSPAILYHHYHGGEYNHGKDELFSSKLIPYAPGIELVKAGYIVMAIDAYAFGERSGKGPDGPSEKGSTEEWTWVKMNMWKGRNHWGMMVRDDLMALDILCKRPDVDPQRIGTIGLSMGCFRAFYVAALDERVKVTVPVSCITRNADLIKAKGISKHGPYYYVHALMKYFDTESIMGCIAPRALLNLSGATDPLEPEAGQRYINESLTKIYSIMKKPSQFKYIIYDGVGHEYNQEMWNETMIWLKEKL